MSVLLAIFSYPGANATLERHWEYFKTQQADWIYGIGTTDMGCKWPQDISGIRNIGANSYIDGPHLPNRMLDTIEECLTRPWTHLLLAEYDVLFLKAIPVETVLSVAGYRAGGPTWGSKAQSFYHPPWAFSRSGAIRFLAAGRKAIKGGICPNRARHDCSVPEASPDVFFGYTCESSMIPVQSDLWEEYSRNSLDIPEHLEEARAAYRGGVSVIHGIKTKEQMEFILS